MRTSARIAMGVLAGALGAAGFVMLPASAASPSKYGWWSELNSGTGIPAPVPPQVPKGGLYVENGYSGPVDISALSFSIPTGATVGSVTLRVAGNPVITKPPVAYLIAPTSLGYQPAQDGPWSKAPSYISGDSVTGTVASGNSSVSFNAAALLRGGSVAMVVLAGGPADSIAFDAPGPDSLQIVPAASAGSAAPPVASPAPYPAVPPPSGTLPAVPGAVTTPAQPSSSGSGAPLTAPPSVGSPVSASPSPQVASPLPAGTSSGTGRSFVRAAAPHSTAWRRDTAELMGLVGLILAIVAWSEGFGLLGGRIRPRRVPVPASEATTDP